MIIKSKKTKWVTLSLLTLSIVSLLAHLSVTKFSTINLVQYSAMAALRADFANVLGAPTQVCVFVFVFCFYFLFFIKPRVYCKLTCKGTGIKRYSNFRIYNNSRRVLFFIHSLLPSYTNNGFFFFFFFFFFFSDFSYFLLIPN